MTASDSKHLGVDQTEDLSRLATPVLVRELRPVPPAQQPAIREGDQADLLSKANGERLGTLHLAEPLPERPGLAPADQLGRGVEDAAGDSVGAHEHAPCRWDVGHSRWRRCQSLQHETAPLAETTHVPLFAAARSTTEPTSSRGTGLPGSASAAPRQAAGARSCRPSSAPIDRASSRSSAGAGCQRDHTGGPAALDRDRSGIEGSGRIDDVARRIRALGDFAGVRGVRGSASGAAASIGPTNVSLAQPANGNVASSPASGDTRRMNRDRVMA